MINVVIPMISNPKSYHKLLKDLQDAEDVNVYIGVVSSLLSQVEQFNADNIFIIEYKDGSKREEIINGLQNYLGEGSIMILRKPITIDEFNNFAVNNCDVVTCKRKYSSFMNFLFMLWQKILRLFLGVKLYEGDTSAIMFGENLAAVIAETNNLSYSSRVDRWRGIEQDTVEVQGQATKTEADKKSNLKYMSIAIISVVVAIVVSVCVGLFVPMSIIVGLLIFCLDVICFAIMLIMVIMIAFNSMVGKKNFDYAIEVDNEENFDEIQEV